MTPKQKVITALNQAQEKGIDIRPGSAAFWKTKGNVYACSGWGAVMLMYGMELNTPYLQQLCENLGVTGWWMRRFYCGFELGRIVYSRTVKGKKSSLYFVNKDGSKEFYIEDEVSLDFTRLRKKYERQ